MSSSFPLRWGNSTLSSEDSFHEASQSGEGGSCSNNTGTSRRDHGGGGEIDLRDRSAVKDSSSIKTNIVDKGTLSPLKTKLIPRSHGMSNSSVMRASLLRTLEELVCQVCDFLTFLGWLITITSQSTASSYNILYGYIKNCSFHCNLLTV